MARAPFQNEPPEPDPDQAWKALTLVNDWIRHAEAKAGVVLAAAGVLGGVLHNLVKNQPHPPCLIAGLAILCGVLVFVAGGCATASLVPRRNVSGGPESFSNLLFYSHVALKYRNDEPSYAEVLSALTTNPKDLTRHLANQVHANSVVADRKFVWASRGIVALVAALVAAASLAIAVGMEP